MSPLYEYVKDIKDYDELHKLICLLLAKQTGTGLIDEIVLQLMN